MAFGCVDGSADCGEVTLAGLGLCDFRYAQTHGQVALVHVRQRAVEALLQAFDALPNGAPLNDGVAGGCQDGETAAAAYTVLAGESWSSARMRRTTASPRSCTKTLRPRKPWPRPC